MIALIPVLMIVAGSLTYALSTNGKVAEIGRLVLMAGLFAFAFAWSSHEVAFLR